MVCFFNYHAGDVIKHYMDKSLNPHHMSKMTFAI